MADVQSDTETVDLEYKPKTANQITKKTEAEVTQVAEEVTETETEGEQPEVEESETESEIKVDAKGNFVDKDGKSYRDIQSMKDKAEAKALKLEKEIESMRQLAELGKILVEDNELISLIQEKRSGKKEDTGIKKPQPPVKPERYDKVDAFNDPDSESYKYREAKEKFNEDMIAYQDRFLDQLTIQEQQLLERQKQQELAKKEINEAKQRAIAEFAMSPEEANEAIEWLSKPENKTFENMLKLYKSVNGKKTTVTIPKGTSTNEPLPAGTSSGKATSTVIDPDDAYNAAVKARNRPLFK